MTEEDTFQRLKRMPYDELSGIVLRHYLDRRAYAASLSLYMEIIEERHSIIENAGWTVKEFNERLLTK